MKYRIPKMAFFLLTVVSCQNKTETKTLNLPGVEESKPDPIYKEIMQIDFQDIIVSQGLKVEVYKAETNRVELIGPKSLVDQLLVETEDTNLMIHCKAGITASAMDEVVIKVYTTSINKIEATSASEVYIKDNFLQDNVLLRAISGAIIEGAIHAVNLEIDAGSSSEVKMNVQAEKLKVICSSSSTMVLSGEVLDADFESSSSATIDAGNLSMQNAKLSAVSSSTIKAGVEKTLEAISSSGSTIAISGSQDLKILRKDESNGSSLTITYD